MDVEPESTRNDSNNSDDDKNDIPKIPLTEYTANKLRQEAFQFKREWDEFQKNYSKSSNDIMYLISAKNLKRWKRYVSYDEMIEKKQPTQFFGGSRPHNFNEDLIDSKVTPCFKYAPIKDHPWNVWTKKNIEECKDYVIVNKTISDFFLSSYEGKQIPRMVIGEGQEKMVEVNLLRLSTILIYPGIVSNFSTGYNSRITEEFMQVSRYIKLSDYYALMEKTVLTFRGNFAKDNNVRLWKYRATDPLKSLTQVIKRQTLDLDYQDDMVFDLDAELLTSESDKTMFDLGWNTEEDLLVIEFKEQNKLWTIKNQAVKQEGKCEGCYQVKVLEFPCVCKKVAYCTEKCKIQDERFHTPKCEKSASDDESVKQMEITDNSVKGVCGLNNLGNTCFMNSGIQCLSNTLPLLQYFLSNKYFDEVNLTNPLGTKGELVKKFGSLLKKLWCGNKTSVAPTALKTAVGKFQPMFKGFHQHDSSELINFLLDGLHEDLNRIINKPYVESPDSDGRPDFDIAKQSWDGFTQRNRSVIVDLMYGQYKSTLRCPKCSRISITFDPYLMVSLSVPSIKKKTISYSLYQGLIKHTKKTSPFEKGTALTVGDFLTNISKEHFEGKHCIMFMTGSYQSFEYVHEKKSLTEIRKKSKRLGLGIRALDDSEVEINPDDRVFIPGSNKLVEGFGYKRSMYQNMILTGSKKWTLKQFHFKIFKDFSFLFRTAFSEDENFDIEFFESQIKDKYFSIELKSNGSFWSPCAYCNKKNCGDCSLPYTDQEFSEFHTNAQESDGNLTIEIIILWKQSPYEKVRLSDIFDHYLKTQTMKGLFDQFQMMLEEKDGEEEKTDSGYKNSNYQYNNQSNTAAVTLQECIQFSQQPEQLESDNTWYCRTCQDHVQAFKSMQIYKAPKILIFNLKRFKSSHHRTFKSKLETLVNFPINGLDMTEYVLNGSIPEEYQNETLQNNGEKKEKKLIYDLYAVSNHFGGLGGGHYTAFAKNHLNNEWYNFDDSHASPINNLEQIISKSAYVLFYKLREEREEQNFNIMEQQ